MVKIYEGGIDFSKLKPFEEDKNFKWIFIPDLDKVVVEDFPHTLIIDGKGKRAETLI